jgi:hypothetical protein
VPVEGVGPLLPRAEPALAVAPGPPAELGPVDPRGSSPPPTSATPRIAAAAAIAIAMPNQRRSRGRDDAAGVGGGGGAARVEPAT